VNVLGVNAVFHDPAAALVCDGVAVAAAEEERFSRRKHGKSPVPFSTWELPEASARWCLESAGLAPEDLDAVAYSYDPGLAPQPDGDEANRRDKEDEAFAFPRKKVTAGEHPLGAVKDHGLLRSDPRSS
jgi:predicted NodU family carbamoyl transferase